MSCCESEEHVVVDILLSSPFGVSPLNTTRQLVWLNVCMYIFIPTMPTRPEMFWWVSIGGTLDRFIFGDTLKCAGLMCANHCRN